MLGTEQAGKGAGKREGRAAGLLNDRAAGFLNGRSAADAALLRMFTRARRGRQPLLLVRCAARGGAATARAGAALAGELRLGDLLWREPGAEWLALLEGVTAPSTAAAAVAARVEAVVGRAGGACECRVAGFPAQGITLAALLEEVGWPH